MNNFYNYIKLINESKEYMAEFIKQAQGDLAFLEARISSSLTDMFPISQLCAYYYEAKEKETFEEFLKSDNVRGFLIYGNYMKTLFEEIYKTANEKNIGDYLKSMYHEIIKSNTEHPSVKDYFKRLASHYNVRKFNEKNIIKIRKAIEENFSVDMVFDYIIEEINKEKYRYDKKMNHERFRNDIYWGMKNYMSELIVATFEGGYE